MSPNPIRCRRLAFAVLTGDALPAWVAYCRICGYVTAGGSLPAVADAARLHVRVRHLFPMTPAQRVVWRAQPAVRRRRAVAVRHYVAQLARGGGAGR